VGRLITAPVLGRAVAGGWGIFWNELLEGAAPGSARRVATASTAFGRAVTANSAVSRWFDTAYPADRPGRPSDRAGPGHTGPTGATVGGMPDYDAIVIGAGHNGLTAATVMAGGGLRVLCLEKNHFIGGMATTTELARGYRFELAGSIQFPVPDQIFDELGFADCPIYEPEVQSAALAPTTSRPSSSTATRAGSSST